MKFAGVGGVVTLVAIGTLAACTIETNPDSPPSSGTSSSTSSSSGGTSSSSGGTSTSSSGGTSSGGLNVNEAEPTNDEFAGAQAVAPGASVAATFGKKDDKDFYAVTIPAGNQDGVLTVTVTETSSNVNPRITLYTATQTELKTFDAPDKTTNPTVFNWDASAGQKYIVRVSDYYGSSDEITHYVMDVKFTPVVDQYERNDSFTDAKEAPLNTAFDLVLFAGDQTNKGDDDDYFSVTVPPSAGKLHVKIKNNSPNDAQQDHRVELFDGTKASKATIDAPNKQADFDHLFDVPSGGGKLYLKFSDYYRTNSSVASKVTLTAE